jgi:hypothetical protein
MKIAILITINNNIKTIKNCIQSLNKIKNKEVYYTNINSTDGTEEYFKKFIKIEKISEKNYENKNNLIKKIKEDWILSIEPWEELKNGYEEIKKITEDKNQNQYKTLILDQDIINKSIRLFKKSNETKFKNEIYEEIYIKNAKTSNILIKKNEQIIENEKEKIENWINKNKTNPRPYYYMCCCSLKNKNYFDFKKYSEKYIFLEKNQTLPSIIMTKYYQSIVELYVYKNIKKSINNIIFCIDQKPTMAEFWCILGDINYQLKKYQKAIYFYENAIMFGNDREMDDDFSIEIKKYKIYPENMIKECLVNL